MINIQIQGFFSNFYEFFKKNIILMKKKGKKFEIFTFAGIVVGGVKEEP